MVNEMKKMKVTDNTKMDEEKKDSQNNWFQLL